MTKSFADVPVSLSAPGEEIILINPANGVDIEPRPRCLYIKTDGNLNMRDKNGTTDVIPVTAGQVIVFRAVGIEATNTTATCSGWR